MVFPADRLKGTVFATSAKSMALRSADGFGRRRPRIDGVSLTDERLFVFLDNCLTFSVEFSVSPVLATIPRHERLAWQLATDGSAVIWNQDSYFERLELERLLNHHTARIGDFPDFS